MIIHTPLYRKENMVDACPCNIIRAMELPRDEFFEFSNNLSEDYSFIADHASEMGTDERGIHQCMLILCKGSEDGILINSSGYDYARYSAYLPNARTVWELNQHHGL